MPKVRTVDEMNETELRAQLVSQPQGISRSETMTHMPEKLRFHKTMKHKLVPKQLKCIFFHTDLR